uniref:Elongator complex protein 2 n=1 Tax=Anser cygnoides TaxID=8845 RepID=A0A8B9EFF9_ANSCY
RRRCGRCPPAEPGRPPAPPSCVSFQAAWCVLPARVLLVLTSQKGIQVSSWFLPAQAVFARGIAAAGERFICVGTSSGTVLVFDIPHKGTNVTVSEVLEEHRDAITDIAAELGQGAGDLVTADDAGTLCIWSSGEEFTLLNKIPVVPNIPGRTLPGSRLWNGVVAAGYGNGQIRLYEAATGVLRAEVNAHARWIYALDLAPLTGKLLSGAEDSFVHVWKLSRNPDTDDVEVSPEARTLGREPGAGVGPCELSLARWDRGSVLLGRTASRGVLLPLGGCGAERWKPSGPSPSCCVGAQRSSPWA